MRIKGHRQLEEAVGALDVAKRLLYEVTGAASDAERDELYEIADITWKLSARAAKSIPKEAEE